jgi:hypothetical protein
MSGSQLLQRQRNFFFHVAHDKVCSHFQLTADAIIDCNLCFPFSVRNTPVKRRQRRLRCGTAALST